MPQPLSVFGCVVKAKYYEVFTIHAEELLMKEIEGTDPNIFHNMTDATLQKVATATSKDGNLMT